MIAAVSPTPAIAAEPTTAAEAVRKSAANLPGFGQTDVFFPIAFAGKWKVTQTIVSSTIPAVQSRLPLTVEYEARFIPSLQDGAVVADRRFNEASRTDAINKVAYYGNNDKSVPPSVRSVQWTENNPNDLRITLSNGSMEDIKVTKRATDFTQDTVSSSEFKRVTKEDARGIPNVSAQRVLQKWKVVSQSQVEGIELIYDVGSGLTDPMQMTFGSSSAPEVLCKSRLTLVQQ